MENILETVKSAAKKGNKEYLLLCKSCPFLKHAGCKSQAQLLLWRRNPLHLWFVWPVFTIYYCSESNYKDLSDIHDTQRCKYASNQRSHWEVSIIAPTLQLISPSESHQPPGSTTNQSVNPFPWQPVVVSFLIWCHVRNLSTPKFDQNLLNWLNWILAMVSL